MSECHYCKRDRNYSCHNTRDMEDFAIDGDDICLGQLAERGGGEKGLSYVCLNRAAKTTARLKAEAAETA